jgi:hypothetical protein
MKTGTLILAGLLLAGPALASTQAAMETTAGTVIFSGEVLRFEPGRLLVVRASDGREMTYTLTPKLAMPAEVQVGRNVTVHSEAAADGVTSVTRVTTTSITPEGQLKRTTEETRTSPTGEVSKQTTSVKGSVVSFTPGRTIVLRSSTGEVVSYELAPSASVPADVQIGKEVTITTAPGTAGSTLVSKVTTTSITSEGDVRKTTEETRREPTGETTKTTTTTVQGKVEAYVPGKSITVVKSDGSAVTFTVPAGNPSIPADVATGRTVTIRTLPNGTVVETIIVHKPE